MKKLLTVLLTVAMLFSALTAFAEEADTTLSLADIGMFSAGGTVTEPVEGEYDPTQNWMDVNRPGNTAHVDHANVLYMTPAEDNSNPIVYLHGYGQSRMGWLTTPDGRDGWAQMFLRNGHAAYLVDQPGRGEAGAATSMTTDGFLDAWAEDSKDYKPGDQAWYTHFRIGRVAPERYEGSQFPEGEEAQNQFFRQMTPNTTTFDMAKSAAAVSAVLAEVKERTGNKSVFITHSQGGAVGWDVDVENISAIIAIEPGGAPEVTASSTTGCWRRRSRSSSTMAITWRTAPRTSCPAASGAASRPVPSPSPRPTTPRAATPPSSTCPPSASPATRGAASQISDLSRGSLAFGQTNLAKGKVAFTSCSRS